MVEVAGYCTDCYWKGNTWQEVVVVAAAAGMKPPVAAVVEVVDMDSDGDLEVHMEHDDADFDVVDDNWNLEGFEGMKK